MKISATTKTSKKIISEDANAKTAPAVEESPVEVQNEVETPVVETSDSSEAEITKPEEQKEEITEPVKEEPMPIIPASPEAAPIVNKKEEAPVSIEVKFMREYISAYKEMITSTMPNAAKCGEALVRILKYAVSKQHSTEVLDELYSFFNEMKLSFLAPHKALAGVASLNKVTRDRVQIVYMLMYELVRGSKGPFDFEYAAHILGGAGFVTYISARLKK